MGNQGKSCAKAVELCLSGWLIRGPLRLNKTSGIKAFCGNMGFGFHFPDCLILVKLDVFVKLVLVCMIGAVCGMTVTYRAVRDL